MEEPIEDIEDIKQINYTSMKSVLYHVLHNFIKVNYELIIDNLLNINCNFNMCTNDIAAKDLLISYCKTLQQISKKSLPIKHWETSALRIECNAIWLLKYVICCKYSIEFPLTVFPREITGNLNVISHETCTLCAKERYKIILSDIIKLKYITYVSPLFIIRAQQLFDSLTYDYPVMKKTKEIINQEVMEYVYHPSRINNNI